MTKSPKSDARHLSTMARTQNALGTLMGGLSIFALAAKTWEGGIAAPVELLVETYRAFLDFFLGWAEPYLHALAATLAAWSGFTLQLHPHWQVNVVAYGILFAAGASALAEAKYPVVPHLVVNVLGGAAGAAAGLYEAMLMRDPQPGDVLHGLWQFFGQSTLLVFALGIALALAAAGTLLPRMKSSFVSAEDAEMCWAAGTRALGIYAGAAAFAVMGVGGKLLGL